MAVCGVPTLSKSGKAIDPPLAAEKTPADVPGDNPRMMAGIKADGTLGLNIVDGRGPYDKGLTSKEAGIMAVHYGYSESVNLDGGGSATLATNIDCSTCSKLTRPIKSECTTSRICRRITLSAKCIM